jgi:transposase-like protein
MPWNEVSVMDQRREFVRLALQEGANRRELCRRFGISPDIGYKWLARWQAGDGELPLIARQQEAIGQQRVISQISGMRLLGIAHRPCAGRCLWSPAPDWAFPVTDKVQPLSTHEGELKPPPGSTKSYTRTHIDDLSSPPDWEFAHCHLSNPRTSFSEIVYLLWYSDQSNFFRVFVRWFGESPGWRN